MCSFTVITLFLSVIITTIEGNRVPHSFVSRGTPPPTIVESIKLDSPLSPQEIENLFLKSKRSPPSQDTSSSSPFCPWGICKFPGFLFGAFFKVPDDMVPTPPSTTGQSAKENVIFIKTHEEQIPDSEKTVIYLLPQKTQHSYKEDLTQGESRNPFSDKFEVVYLGGSSLSASPSSSGASNDAPPPSSSKVTKNGRTRHVRRIMRRVIKALKDKMKNPETVTSVSVSYSVSHN